MPNIDVASLEGQPVVVTGGSRGIGRATAAAFAREGATLVLAASSAAHLADAAAALRSSSGAEPTICARDLRSRSNGKGSFKL